MSEVSSQYSQVGIHDSNMIKDFHQGRRWNFPNFIMESLNVPSPATAEIQQIWSLNLLNTFK